MLRAIGAKLGAQRQGLTALLYSPHSQALENCTTGYLLFHSQVAVALIWAL